MQELSSCIGLSSYFVDCLPYTLSNNSKLLFANIFSHVCEDAYHVDAYVLICLFFNVTITQVDNFTVSMSDGRVMCYLLHYYHPRLLREEEICRETTQTCNPYTNEDDSIDDDSLNSKDESFGHQKGILKLQSFTLIYIFRQILL